jgi:hypothetical protein
MSNEVVDNYELKGRDKRDTGFVLVGYNCDENKYVFVSFHPNEEVALRNVEVYERRYNYHYYCIYEDSGCDTKVYGKSFWVYKYRKIVASKRCSYKSLPIPLNSMLIGQFVDISVIGGRWVLYM